MVANKKNGILIGISLIIALTIFAFIISLAVSKSGVSSLQNQAEKYMKNQEYQLAANSYGRLITKTGEEKFKEKREEALKLKNEFSTFSFGIEKIKNEEYISAIKYFKKIDREESIYFEKSQQELLNIENKILNQVEVEIENGDIFLANSILNDYLRIAGESEKVEKLKAKIIGEDDELVDSETDSKDIVEELPSDSNKWVGMTVEIKVGRANLRAEASLDSREVGIAVQGDTIKIQKISDDGGRIWCYGVVTSQKTGKTQTAWISSRNL